MATKHRGARKEAKSLVERVLQRAERAGTPEGGVGPTWWYITKRDAELLVREAFGPARRPPSIGWQIDLPITTRNGRHGFWCLSHSAGRFELQFMYRS